MTASTQDTKPTSVSEWKKSAYRPVELPSGKFMRIRRLGMSTLLSTGKLPNALVNIIKPAVDRGTGMEGVEDKMSELMADEHELREMTKFMDELVTMVAMEPKVHKPPKHDEDRDPDLLYTDEIDEADKSFLFQLVTGGTTDLEEFRKATESSVATLSGRQDVQLPAERATQTD